MENGSDIIDYRYVTKKEVYILKLMKEKCLRSLYGCLPVWNVIINHYLQENKVEKRIFVWKPYFFMLFGHRVGVIDRSTYAEFWISVLENKGLFYFVLKALS